MKSDGNLGADALADANNAWWSVSAWRHLTADGKAAELTHASPANQTRDFPPPVQPPPSVS